MRAIVILVLVVLAGALVWVMNSESPTAVDTPARNDASDLDSSSATATAVPTPSDPTREVVPATESPVVSPPHEIDAGLGVAGAVQLTTATARNWVFGTPQPSRILLTGHPAGAMDFTNPWTDLPAGSYSIDINDPRYERWTKTGVHPGDAVLALLVGSCSITLTVLDPSTGAPIDTYRLRVRYVDANLHPNEFVVREAQDALPEGGVYTGIVPGNIALVVDAEGFATTEFVLGEVEPHTTQSCTITLARGATVRGTVVDASSRAPVANAIVRLRPPPKNDDDEFFESIETAHLRRKVVTDAHGAFAITNVIPGTYELIGELNALVAAPRKTLVLKPGETVETTLELPAHGTLRGRLSWMAETPPTGLRVAARASPAAGAPPPKLFDVFDAWEEVSQPVVATVAPDGSFELATLPAGAVDVVLGLPDPRVDTENGGWGGQGDRWVIGSAIVRGDEVVEAMFDLGARHPGFVRLSVTVKGASRANLGVRAIGPPNPFSTLTAAANLDANGEALLGPTPPGRYDLVVSPPDSSWFASFPASFTLRPAATATVTHAIELHRGTILLVDASGTPLPNRSVYFASGDLRAAEFTSDAAGRIELVFPAFHGEIRDAKPAADPSAAGASPEYVWPPASGELRVILK